MVHRDAWAEMALPSFLGVPGSSGSSRKADKFFPMSTVEKRELSTLQDFFLSILGQHQVGKDSRGGASGGLCWEQGGRAMDPVSIPAWPGQSLRQLP